MRRFRVGFRRSVPRAGLLGSLAAIALVLISFLPLLDIAAHPVAGLVALGLILATLTATLAVSASDSRGAGAVAIGLPDLLRDVRGRLGAGAGQRGERSGRWRSGPSCRCRSRTGWPGSTSRGREALRLSAGGDSARAGDGGGRNRLHGEPRPASATITRPGRSSRPRASRRWSGRLFGGVIQSTPYIGHPAYKAMGARSAYTLATALFVGAAGIFGFFDWIFFFIPKAVIFPILIFVGLEITSQSFHATPVRHYPAVALACVPALAYLAVLAYKQLCRS